MTIRLAEVDFCRPLSPETRKRLNVLFRAIYWVDSAVDETKGERQNELMRSVVAFIKGEERSFPAHPEMESSLVALKESLEEIPSERKELFIEAVQKIFDYTPILTQTKSTQTFIEAREKEAEATATLVLLVSDELYGHTPFEAFYKKASVMGNMFDSIEDARKDQKNGEISISPLRLSFALVKAMVCRLPQTVAAHPHKVRILGTAVGWTLSVFYGNTKKLLQRKFARPDKKTDPSSLGLT